MNLPYLNQYDAGASDLGDFFADEPDYTPYNAVEVDKRIFDPQKAMDPMDEDFNWEAVEQSPVMDNVEDMRKDSKERDEDRLKNREKQEVKEKK